MKYFGIALLVLCGFPLVFFFIKSQSEFSPPTSISSAEAVGDEPLKSDSLVFLDKASSPSISATSLYVVDLETGKALLSKNPDLLVSPASTTKMMTALTAISSFGLDNVVTVPKEKVEGQSMHLLWGEKISVESLLYGLLVFSANDSAEVFAQTYPEGRNAFIDLMNIEAKRLGLTQSVFKNPTGLPEAGHVTTAREMANLGKYVMDNTVLRNIVGTKKAIVTSADLKITHNLSSTNELLAEIPGVLGVKTGWTEESGENLVTYIDRGHPIIISLFGSSDRFGETKKLIDWVYENYSWK